MQDSSLIFDVKTVRKTYDETFFPFLVSYRTVLLSQVEKLAFRLVKQLNTAIRAKYSFLELLDVVEELSTDLDRISKNIAEKDRIQEYYQALGSWQHQLPTRRMYPQNDICYSSLPTDSVYVKTGKQLKRLHRGTRSTFHSSKRYARRLAKKPSSDFPIEQHEIRWIRVSRALSVEILDQLAAISYDDHSWFSKCAALLNDICDHGNSAVNMEQLRAAAEQLHATIKAENESIIDRLAEISNEVFDRIIPLTEFMGTFQESRQHFNTNVLDKRDASALHKIRNLKSDWRSDCQTRLSQLRIDIGLHRFNNKAAHELKTFQQFVHATAKEPLTTFTRSTYDFLKKNAEKYRNTPPDSVRTQAFYAELTETSKQINNYLNKAFSEPFYEVLDSLDFGTAMESCLSNINLQDELLPDRSLVFDSKASEPVKPRIDSETLNFRSELTTYIKNDLFRKLRKVPFESTRLLNATRSDVDDILQVASVNLTLALELLENEGHQESDQNILELIHLGIDRAAKRITELTSHIERSIEQNTTESEVLFEHYLQVARETMLDDNYLYIRTKNREAMVVSKSIDWQTKIQTQWILLWDQVLLWYRFIARILRKFYFKAQFLLGFATENDSAGYVQAGASEFLSETEQRLAELPLIYRRLFSEEALHETRFFRGRSTVQAMLTESYGIWCRGHFSNFIVVGEKGSGKTSCMQLLPDMVNMTHPIVSGMIAKTIWTEKELIHELATLLQLQGVTDKEELIALVNGSSERRIVILEGFQNLYLRYIRGFEALEAFLLIVSMTSGKIYWVLSCSRYAWELLNKIYQTAGYFSYISGVDHVSSEVIEDVIMTRHRVSGYDLQFIPSSELKSNRSFKKLEVNPSEQQKLVRQEFFKGLSKVAQGNIAIAMLYWMRSIRSTGLDSIEIAPFSEINVTLGDAFTPDDLFALAALVQHDDVTISELALVLNVNEQISRLILSKLAARAILLEKNQRFYLNPLLYRHIVNLLKLKNMIH